MFEQAFKNIDADLRNEAGCTTELDYTEQTSWLLFLKYLDGLEQDKAMEAELEGKKYAFILDEAYRWSSWAAPKDKDGKLDHNKAQTGDDLREFVDRKLFPYLHGFKLKATGPNTIEYKIGEIFGEIKNKIQSGYTLREIIDHIDELRFRSQAEKHELSHLYEAKIKNMGNAGRNGGEYYTPRPLIRAMVRVVQPKVGERIYDGACGSAGFLCESFDYLRQQPKLTADNLKTLQERTFYGKEKKPLAYVIAIMNMILHGIEAPNIIHTNTLTENLADIQDKDRMDVILANPPFGGGERKEVQQNFPIRTGETAFLFLQHFIKMLKAGGRAAVVIKNTFLSNTDNASVSLRKLLLESCNLHTILDLPTGVFQGTTVRTVVLFFEKGAPTRKIWIYRLDPGRPLGKTSPLNDEDLRDFLTSQAAFNETANSWFVNVNDLDATTHEIPIKNGESNATLSHQTPQVLIGRLHRISTEGSKVVGGIAKWLENHEGSGLGNKSVRTLGELCNFYRGLTYSKSDEVEVSNNIVLRATNIDLSSNSLDLTELRYISDSVVVPESKKVRKDALIICTASGSKSHLGKVAYIDDDLDYAFGGFMGMLVPKPELLPKYLFYYMTSPAYKDFIASLSDGANINNLKFDDLKKFRISCPSLLEQKRIVDELDLLTDEAKRLESLYRDELAVLEVLKSSSLHFAFQ